MTNKHTKQQLQEQLLAEFDAVDKFGKFVGRTVGSGAKALGSIAGGVAGLGTAMKQGYQAGKQNVGGGGANVQTKQQPQQQGNNLTKQKTSMGDKVRGAIGKGLRNIDQVGNYDYTKGTQTQQDKLAAQKTAQQQQDSQGAKYQTDLAKAQGKTVGTQPGAQQAPAGTQTQAQTQAQATKRTKTGGKVAGQVSNTASAQSQRDRRAAKKNAVSTGISQAQKDAANQGVANMQKQQAGQTATKVPGQKKPTKTAQNVGKNANVNTAKIGKDKLDLNDPRMKNLRALINKADPSILGGVDKLQPDEKAKLKKAIS